MKLANEVLTIIEGAYDVLRNPYGIHSDLEKYGWKEKEKKGEFYHPDFVGHVISTDSGHIYHYSKDIDNKVSKSLVPTYLNNLSKGKQNKSYSWR